MYTETKLKLKLKTDVETKLDLISKHAKENKEIKFTSLAHLLNVDLLWRCFFMLDKDKAPGIDEVTFNEYKVNLEVNLEDLVERMKNKKYYPQPVLRVYIPKGDGQERPIGILCLEDKIVQQGIAMILNAIYEPIFLDNSYGFRPERNCHEALNRVDKIIMKQPINHVIDADVKGFFDNVEHDWLMKMLKEKIVDKNFLNLIYKFLRAGIMDEGILLDSDVGTPQGGVISPILANVYLHYTLDLWFEGILKKEIKGKAELVRFADDFVIMVQYKEDAILIKLKLDERMSKFGLELSKEKTRVIEFGKYAEQNARRKGKKPESFDFLGFTHFCDKTRRGRFKLGRKTQGKRLSRKLKKMNEWLKSVRNACKIKEWWKILKSKLNGHYQYYGISGNMPSLKQYYFQTHKLVFKWINRRSQKRSMTLDQFFSYLKKYKLPAPKIKHNFYTLYS